MRASRGLSFVAAGVAAYLAFLLARYFWPPHIPRFRIETFFMWFLAIGAMAVALRAGTRPQTGDIAASRLPDLIPAGGFAALAIVCTAAAFALWGASLRVGLLSDDFVLADWAARREWVHAAETGFMRPVVPMLWAALSLVPMRLEVSVHAANVLLHALNAVLIAAVAVGTGLRRHEAFAASVLFVTFAGLSEAIVWASGVQDVLMTTLALTAIAATLALDQRLEPLDLRRIATIGVAVSAAALALGVKETAVVIPLLAWTAAWASARGIQQGAQRRTLWMMTALAGAYAMYRAISGVSPGYGQVVSRYFAKQLIVDPFATLAEPWSAAWAQAHPAGAFIRAVTILGLLVAAFWSWHRGEAAARRALVFGGWVLLAVLPVFSFFHVSATLEGSRYLYLPAVGFVLSVGTMAGDLSRRIRSWHSSALFGAILVALAVPSAVAIPSEVQRWMRAAEVRGRILDSSTEVAAARCGSIVTEGLADNVDGAYVLRNGFAQAVGARGFKLNDVAESRPCQVTWTDRLIVR